MSLLPHSQGNIWLFEDSVLITRKLPGTPQNKPHTGLSEVLPKQVRLDLTDSSSEPKVRFPKSLLTLPDGGNLSSVAAFLTVPRHHLGKDCANCTLGIASSKSGKENEFTCKNTYLIKELRQILDTCLIFAVSRSVELKAVAAVSVLLFSEGVELHVRGPIQISLPLGGHTAIRAADTIPAWAFNLKTGRTRHAVCAASIAAGR